MRIQCASIALALCLALPTNVFAEADEQPLLVFAAASLGGPLDTLTARYMNRTGVPILIAYGASGSLAQQIRVGADVDLFISADTAWVQWLVHDPNSPIARWEPFLHNRLVLVTSSSLDYKTRDFGPLESPSIGKIAIADPVTAPAGRYARAYMQRIGVYDKVQSKLVIQEDVRGVVNAVRLEVADVGFVYASDLAISPHLRLVEVIPDSLYPPVVYGLAVLKSGHTDETDRLVDYLTGPEADSVFTRFGFLHDSAAADVQRKR